MWSQDEPIEDITVVSEIGEQWSPKIPPERTTPIAIPIGAPQEIASEQAIGVKIANTPHDVPVANDVRQAAMNMIAHIDVGVRKLSHTDTIHAEVPTAAQMLLIPHASIRIIRTSII